MTLAWSIARLSRADRIPDLEDLLGRPTWSPEARATEMKVQMQVYRKIAAEQGRIRSWEEWQR